MSQPIPTEIKPEARADQPLLAAGPHRHLAGVLRVSLLALLLAAAALLFIGQRVHAYGEEVLERFGDHMLKYAEANHQHAPTELKVNGASFYVSTGNIDASVSEVLDHFHAKCQEKNGQLHEQWASLAKKKHVELDRYQLAGVDGVFRAGGDETGVIACTETGDGQLPPEQLMSRIKQVLETGDLSKLGDLRYVYVMRGDARTAFVALWSEGPLNYKQMFPPQADAPGNDPPGIPRPAGTRRILSTYPIGHKASLNMYQSKQRADELVDFYWRELPQAGFQFATGKKRFLSAHDGARMITISLQDDARTGHGVATIATQAD
jgi:hypothetical protein